MTGRHFFRKRGFQSKYARSQRLRRAKERELKQANPEVAANELKKEVVKKLCTNSLFFSISKIKNHHNGSMEVRYDEAPYIRLLHQSGLSYVDIEKTLKEEGRYVSRQTISLVARNLKTFLYRVLHIPDPVDIPEAARQWIEKRFSEYAPVSDVQNGLEAHYGISASLYQLVSIKKELQQSLIGSLQNNPSVHSANGFEANLNNPKKENDIDLADISESQSLYPNLCSRLTTPKTADNVKRVSPVVSDEEPLSIVCCPDLLPYTSNISPFPLETSENELENSNDSSGDASGLSGAPLSIVCCPDLPSATTSTSLNNHKTESGIIESNFHTFTRKARKSPPEVLEIVQSDTCLNNHKRESSTIESSFHMFARKARKSPPEDMEIILSDGRFSPAFLEWAKRHSTWEGNFASTLSQYIFTDKERFECNCMGIRKKALDPRKLYLIRQAVFQLYNVADDDKGRAWNNCIKAIDSSARTFRCKNKFNVPPSSP